MRRRAVAWRTGSRCAVGVDRFFAICELPDLLHPRPDLLVVLATGWLRLGQVSQEAPHALHLPLDELHVLLPLPSNCASSRMRPSSVVTAPVAPSAIGSLPARGNWLELIYF